MSQDHRLQQQRFELKYLIDEAIAPSIRDFLTSYLELDEYGADRPNFSYPVHSLYLDSDDLRTYQESVNGSKNRFLPFERERSRATRLARRSQLRTVSKPICWRRKPRRSAWNARRRGKIVYMPKRSPDDSCNA